MSNSVWILGAGFSKMFGLPLASELHKAALETPLDPSMADRKSNLGKLNAIWDVFKAYLATDDLEQCSIEDIIGLLNTLRSGVATSSVGKRPHDLFNIKVDPKTLDDVRDELQERALRAIRYRCSNQATSQPKVQDLIRNIHKSGGSIITLNFDDIAERLALSIGVDVSHTTTSANQLLISHLHGCAYWYWQLAIDEDLGSVGDELYRATDALGNEGVIRKYDDPDHPFFDGPNLGYMFKRTKFEACVRMDVLKSVEWFLSPQWKAATEAVDSADIWVIIGYSFPETDRFLRLWFVARLVKAYQYRGKFPKILLVNPSAKDKEFRSRLMRVVTNQAEWLPATLSEALDRDWLWQRVEALLK